MKKITSLLLIFFLVSCTSVGRFGTGVDITFDPRTIGMQIDDTIMQKNLNNFFQVESYSLLMKLQRYMNHFIEKMLIELICLKVQLKVS